MTFASFIILVLISIVTIRYMTNKVEREREKKKIISNVTHPSHGEWSERDLIFRLAKAGIPVSTIFHDVYIPTKNGYTQIDLVVPTSMGIFVFEVKDYSGWIFGDARYDKWTQVLSYGQEKHQFYNPIKQNTNHILALQNTSNQLKSIPIFSIIVFYGSCELKNITNIPKNCWLAYDYNVANIVKSIMANRPAAPYTDKWEIMQILRSAVENGKNEYIRKTHLQVAQKANAGKFQSTYNYKHIYLPRLFGLRRYRF